MGVLRTHNVCTDISESPAHTYNFTPIGKKMHMRVDSSSADANPVYIMIYAGVAGMTGSYPRISGYEYSDPATYLDPVKNSGIYEYDLEGLDCIRISIYSISDGTLTVKVAEFE
jgi:hypothetical protein